MSYAFSRTHVFRTGSSRRASQHRAATKDVFAIPGGPNEAIDQAGKAILQAYQANNVKRQRVELLLPLIGATDLDDWPGGIRQQFKAALPMVENLMRRLKEVPGLQGSMKAQILDDADAVGAWSSDTMLAVVFPTAETLSRVQDMAEGKELVLLINPQWQGGQIVSDFGFFGRKRKEEFVKSFVPTYCLKSLRMCGEDLRIMTKDGRVQLFVQEFQGRQSPEMVFVQEFEELPSYFELEKLLQARPGSLASMSLVDRIKAEMAFNEQSVK